jgi:hypothetical protein
LPSLLPAAVALGLVFGRPDVRAASPPPILATEDSLRVYTAPETTRVQARRIPLAEIIRKAQEGERRKYEGIRTLAFNRTIKLTMVRNGREPQTRCIETVVRVWFQSPDQWRQTTLREARWIVEADGTRRAWDDDEGTARIRIESGPEGRSLADLPPYLEQVEKFSFRIVNRSVRPDQVLYEIDFEPRSDFDVLPGGRLWLLTNGYQIVREEYRLENLPVPWLLKSVGLLTREWQEIEGHWVQKRITARAELRSGLGLGVIDVPNTAEIVVLFDQYKFDAPLDPALFEPGTGP